MDILDKTLETEECDATKKEGQINSTEEPIIGGWIGQDGERRKSYSASVMDDIKRKSRIVVGYFIVRNTNSRQNNGGGCSSLFTVNKDRACYGRDIADHGRWQ